LNGTGQNISLLGVPYAVSAVSTLPTVQLANNNQTFDNAYWLGFSKATNGLPYYVRGYIGLLVVLTLHGVCRTRVRYRQQRRLEPLPQGVVFPETTRDKADAGVISCAKYLINYGFYRFGVEVSFAFDCRREKLKVCLQIESITSFRSSSKITFHFNS
jgi:hypothetical protein